MKPLHTIKDIARESRIVRNRVIASCFGILFLAGLLVLRMAQLQVLEYEHFSTLSEDNRVKIVPLAPTRGLIYDRNGVELAQNTPTFSLEIVPENVDNMAVLLTELGELVEITPADTERFRNMLKKKRPFQSVPLRFRLNEEEVARVSVNRHRFPGADVHARLTRSYPRGASGVHLLGYVASMNEEDLQRVDAAAYRGTTHIGKTGVEQAYESLLHGKPGLQRVETNAQGRILRVLERSDPVPGNNIYLTIDASLQAVAERALGDENGAIVAVDPSTGGLLAFVSMPVYDPNLFVDGIDSKTYRKLLASPERPLFNRALNGQYPPGSTVKPFVGLAGQELEQVTEDHEIFCPGGYRLPGRERRYRDWKKWGHGKVDITQSIVQSCDVYYYTLARQMGIEALHDYMALFGFGQRTGIDLHGESAGLMPSTEWKRRSKGQAWFPGETLITGIGQGFTLATPLQLAMASATLSTRGVRLRPQIVLRRDDAATQSHVDLVPETLDTVAPHLETNWQTIINAMADVVHGPKGTARRIGVGATYRIAGKTGTAQVFGIAQDEEYDAEKVDKKLHDHALFIAFAPVDNPRIALAVLVENGGSGSKAAAPIARKVMDHYFQQVIDDDAEQLILTAAELPTDENAAARRMP
ncbi:MAG: penicillin-binding protein 2 [Gammaproteobacteria bacterium]|nr:penicillin-binding protein 2 [Gammaproteobacteria bacterium]MDX2458927.1 penicillin-binding protein 2 [Gammaproteobacteria bacterium]